jgi:hypothetical protein
MDNKHCNETLATIRESLTILYSYENRILEAQCAAEHDHTVDVRKTLSNLEWSEKNTLQLEVMAAFTRLDAWMTEGQPLPDNWQR